MDDSTGSPPLTKVVGASITDADLHAYVDGELAPERIEAVEQHLAQSPQDLRKVQGWQQQNRLLQGLLAPVLSEPVPPQWTARRSAAPLRRVSAMAVVLLLGVGGGWVARGAWPEAVSTATMVRASAPVGAQDAGLAGFARRAAVAHAVYSPEVRRPVEVGADQEQQLVAWLTKRLGATIRPPSLQPLGYELVGGRLLAGEVGPVAQFMYQDSTGQRMTLYVTRELATEAHSPTTAFQFGQDGNVNVFYWVDKQFAYAISGAVNRQELMTLAQEVYRQLGAA
jgi:anti-sigma factor RsiW